MCIICDGAGAGRRSLLGMGLAAPALGLAGAAALSGPGRAQPSRAAATADEALERLMEGNRRYVADQRRELDLSPRRNQLSEGQRPHAIILGCSDSRVAPEIAFDQRPGDLFVVRVAGNFVTDAGLGSIEYGVAELGIPLVMVLGHSDCGALTATVAKIREGERPPGQIGTLVDALRPAVESTVREADGERVARAVRANVEHNVRRLRETGPILARKVAAGDVRVVGGVYALGSGRIEML